VDEFDLIDRLIAPLAVADGARGLTDDGAVLTPTPGMELALTKDLLTENVHFLADDPPGDVARKLLRTNLSDLAAMGARPLGYLLGLASDGRRDDVWFRAFVDGLADDQDRYGLSLLGGDTISTASGVLTLSLTAIGEIPAGQSLARSGARPGDHLAVSGTIGDGAFGLLVRRDVLSGLSDKSRAFLVRRYRLPEPRVALGAALLGRAHAALDVSDGLVADAGHMARRSGLAIEIDQAAVPLSSAAREVIDRDPSCWPAALTGGDDYELLIAFDPGRTGELRDMAAQSGTDLTIIGRCLAGRGIRILDADGLELQIDGSGWRHEG